MAANVGLLARNPFNATFSWAVVMTSILRVMSSTETVRPSTNSWLAIFSAREKLEQAHVKFDGDTIVEEGMVKTATFFDPDGNALMLAEDLTQPS